MNYQIKKGRNQMISASLSDYKTPIRIVMI